jgi:3',5'-cyclic AMP phosphodiesterase CpdA
VVFTLAHLSDPHVGPLVQPRFTELMGKRLTGYWNWKRHRHSIHHMGVLAGIIADIAEQGPDHIALTGDLVNLGMEREYLVAYEHLKGLGDHARVSIVPGNHDAYVRGSLDMMHLKFGVHMHGDAASEAFPYLRVRGAVALIGLNSAIPTAPLIADGALGAAQAVRFDAMLEHARKTYPAVVVMIHHPPHRGGAKLFRGLRDAVRFEEILARHGADLVIHGHNHKRSLAWRPGPNGSKVPLVGVASASAVPGDPQHLAAYHLYRLTPGRGRCGIEMVVRGMQFLQGPVTEIERITLV